LYSLFGKIVGFQLSFLLTFGTHEMSVGIQAKGYAQFDYAQFNLGDALVCKIYSLGKRRFFFENRAYGGLCLMVGNRNSVIDFELDGLSHQTHRDYAVAFNYLIYSDNVATSQLSGAFGLYVKNVSIRFENDVFGGQARDRFRTGIVHITYRTQENKFGIGLNLWTGETDGSFWDKTATTQKMPNGYRTLEDLPYGKTSHGIGYVSVQRRVMNQNVASVKLGIDSEHVRHLFQNRLIHDLIFLPKNVKRNTPHYPRLDKDGCPTFDKKDVRKTKLYFQTSWNALDH